MTDREPEATSRTAASGGRRGEGRAAPSDRALERTLWVVVYVLLVLGPLALLVAVPSLEHADDLRVPVAVGLLALTVLALQVVLPSRAPGFTAPFGIDLLIRFHRAVGFVALALVATHVGLMVAAEDDFLSWLNPFEAPLPGRLGIGALAALAALAATAVWRRSLGLRYESWRGLHIVLGLCVLVFAFGHVLAVSRFSQVPTIRWVMLGFVGAALVAAFYGRIARPFLATRRGYRLARLGRERDGALTLELEADGHEGSAFAPGQFAWLKHAGAPYALTEHPFSYASSAVDPRRPSFTVKPVGDFTRALEELEPGARLLVDGPHGSPALVDERDSVLIAGGSGITPVMSVLRTAAEEGDARRLMLVYLTREAEDVAFSEELSDLSRRLDLRLAHVPSRPPEGWTGPSGRVSAELLDALLPTERSALSYFVCGPPAMTDVSLDALADLGVPRAAIRAERFALA